MKHGFRKVTSKIGEILYLAVSCTDPNQDPLTKARQYDFYKINSQERKS